MSFTNLKSHVSSSTAETMTSRVHNNSSDIYNLLERLCKGFVGENGNHREILRYVAQYVTNCPAALNSTLPYNENTLVTKITQHIQSGTEQTTFASTSEIPGESSTNKESLFLNLHQQLKSTQLESRTRSALLTFLYYMADSKCLSDKGRDFYKINLDVNALLRPRTITPSTLSSKCQLNMKKDDRKSHDAISDESNHRSRTSAQILKSYTLQKAQQLNNHITVSNEYCCNTKLLEGSLLVPNACSTNMTATKISLLSRPVGATSVNVTSNNLCTSQKNNTVDDKERSMTPSSVSAQKRTATLCPKLHPGMQHFLDTQHNLNDDIVQNVIYTCTGIQGKYLKKDIVSRKYKLDPKAKLLNIVQAGMVLKLAELGYYHDLVLSYTDTKSGRCALGLMGQGFICALKHELTQYYGMVAMLQEQLNKQRISEIEDSCSHVSILATAESNRLTLMKMLVWSVNPLQRLKLLASIAEACQEKKGGALASTVHSFLNSGSPIVKNIAKGLLLAICGPFYQMLSKWLLEGEIYDQHNEFFIECLTEVGPDRLWYDKYRVRTSMLPNFVTTELANKILITGKSINFLCEICEDKQPVKGRDDLKHCIEENGEHIFSKVADTKLHSIIDTIYLNTSKRVLDIVMGPHKLLEHLQAMRRYLLLGQGDFIAILMENFKHELNKPAKELYTYDLSSIMDATIRSTNAQFDDPEILNHLDVRLISPFDGDIGWDILTLKYTLHGPLATMLEPSMSTYQMLFKPLWRMKHIEFLLSSKIWKDQKCNAKSLRSMQLELRNVLYRLHLFTSEMIHFIHQMQYYILFEVIECSWAELHERVQQAKTLDDILNAHNAFLEAVRCGIFLDKKSRILCQNMEAVFETIIRLEMWQDKFYLTCFRELNARREYDNMIKDSEKSGEFGTTNVKKLERDQEKKCFEQTLSNYYKLLENIGNDYEKSVRRFLLGLNSNNNHNLQLFGIRLDFNEYYKKRDQRLGVPLTFEHMRMSNIHHNINISNSKNLLNNHLSSIN